VTAALRRLRRRLRAPRWTIGRELALLVFAALLPFAVLGLYWTHEDYRTEQVEFDATTGGYKVTDAAK
jgi:hypothetical protein